MKNLVEEYHKQVEFDIIGLKELTVEKIEGLEVKKGLVIEVKDSTDLWIRRELRVYPVLNIPTVMEATDGFVIMDSFGFVIWHGEANSIVEYANGFLENQVIF
jgi:hypothetical protein